jgi:hypothetical protein
MLLSVSGRNKGAGDMGESECSCCEYTDVEGRGRSSANPITAYQRMEKVEELIGDLIRFIARTNAKTTNGENQLAELEFILARLDSQQKTLLAQNESILRRLTNLESHQDTEQSRRKSFVMDGRERERFPQSFE